VAPRENRAPDDDGSLEDEVFWDQYQATDPTPGENIEEYMAGMSDPTQWVVPEPPQTQSSTYTLQTIRLERLPLEATVDEQLKIQQITKLEAEKQAEYRASLPLYAHQP
jgi:hypothetical protein